MEETRSYLDAPALQLTKIQKQEMAKDIVRILRLHQDMETYLEEFIERYLSSDHSEKIQEKNTGLHVIMNVASMARDMQEDRIKAEKIRVKIQP